MQWGSISEFLAMGGYGFYVWSAYLVTAAALAWEIWMLRKWNRTLDAAMGRRAGEEIGR